MLFLIRYTYFMIQNFDLLIFNAIHNLAGKSRLLDFLGIFLADYLGYLMVLVAVVILSMESDWRKKFVNFSLVSLSLIVSRGIISEVIRAGYYRSRPFIVLNFNPLVAEVNHGAFPSGHAAFYFALAGVIWLFDRKWGWRFIFAAALMGVARVVVGVHWPLDIAGGAAVGILSVLLTKAILFDGGMKQKIAK